MLIEKNILQCGNDFNSISCTPNHNKSPQLILRPLPTIVSIHTHPMLKKNIVALKIMMAKETFVAN